MAYCMIWYGSGSQNSTCETLPDASPPRCTARKTAVSGRNRHQVLNCDIRHGQLFGSATPRPDHACDAPACRWAAARIRRACASS